MTPKDMGHPQYIASEADRAKGLIDGANKGSLPFSGPKP